MISCQITTECGDLKKAPQLPQSQQFVVIEVTVLSSDPVVKCESLSFIILILYLSTCLPEGSQFVNEEN